MPTSEPPSAAPSSSNNASLEAFFALDPRVYFSKESETWRYEADDGEEMEYDVAKGAWVPVLDEELVKAQQAAYSVAGVDEETPAAPILAHSNKKRKGQTDYTGATSSSTPSAGHSIKRTRGSEKNSDKSVPPSERKSKNTAVYVTGLPMDTELEELLRTFGKCGLIEEDDAGEPKVKMYARDDGTFIGDALVVYFKEDSVFLALNLLDDAELRLGDASTVMRVQKADFRHKNTEGGEAKPRKTIDKKKTTKRIGKMQKKLLEWDDEDGFGPLTTPQENEHTIRNDRVVVLKHMFTLKELEDDASLLLDLKEDVREECSSLGDVTNVVLYDKEPDGIMTVKFRDPLSAQACVIKMNGRFFSGRRIEAVLFSGRQRFRRSGTAADSLEAGGEEAEKQRLDDFAKWLMAEGEG